MLSHTSVSDWLPVAAVLVAVVGSGVFYGRKTPWPWRLLLPLLGGAVGVAVALLAIFVPFGPWLSPLMALLIAAIVLALSLYLKKRGVG